MTASKCIDSSVWLEYFFNGSFKDIIEGNEMLFISSLSLFEIKKKLIKSGNLPKKVSESIEFVKERSLIISIGDEIAEYAADVSNQHNLGAVDALIYASAIKQNAILITLDNDFRGLNNVMILD